MASNNIQSDTNAALSQEINYLKARCKEECEAIANNAPNEMVHFNPENLKAKSLCYVDGLRAQLQATEIPVVTDDNVVTGLFLAELDEKISQLEELAAFKNGLVQDVNAKILELNKQIKMAEDAKKVPDRVEVRPEHLKKAKQHFNVLKEELHNLIFTLHPNIAKEMIQMLAELMHCKIDEASDSYMEIESEKFHLAEILRDMGVVVSNPYNKMKIKLAD